MNPLYRKLIRSSVIGTLVLAALIFVPAGTLHYWQGWAYLVVFVACSAAYTLYLAKYDPALLKRRTEGGVSYERELTQKVVMVLLNAAFLLLVVLSPLDVRFGWSNLPWYVCVLGDGLAVASFYIFYLVSKVNTFAAANIRVEQGQTVIATGMYGLVRHPMYFGALFLFIGTPLALGSWWTLFLLFALVPILVVRILNEEEVLERDLPGYPDYRAKVRTRLVPFVW
jgi:protein-S-isoprenylcysteine O-methyltransferase Ste14